MAGHEYLSQLLEEQKVYQQVLSQLQGLRSQIEDCLRNAYGSTPRFYYGGSYGKKTMIKAGFDLDIIMYFPPSETRTLKTLFWGVNQTLKGANYITNPKTVAIELPYKEDFHIDVVPGKAQDSAYRYATLYKNLPIDSTLQTSLKIHIDAISDSACREIIKLMKLWKIRHNLNWKSIALEQTVIRSLNGKRKDDYATAIWNNVLPFMRDNIERIRLEDPANTNNVFEMSQPERLAIKTAAINSLGCQYWKDVIW